jgi:hypothetical protein
LHLIKWSLLDFNILLDFLADRTVVVSKGRDWKDSFTVHLPASGIHDKLTSIDVQVTILIVVNVVVVVVVVVVVNVVVVVVVVARPILTFQAVISILCQPHFSDCNDILKLLTFLQRPTLFNKRYF